MTGRLLALAPMRIEAAALRRGAPGAMVARTGMGPTRAARRASALAADLRAASAVAVSAVAVTGVCGALAQGMQPGDLVVASEVRGPHGTVTLPSPIVLATALRRAGLRVHVGPVASAASVLRGPARHALAGAGALAVDMESAWLAAPAWDRPLAVVRAVVDTPERELVSPATVPGGVVALRALRRAGPVLEAWAAAARPRRVLLAGPRSFCAGVDRAIVTVERAIERYGTPVYVRRQIVHNRHVVADLEGRGAIFVEELDEVPDGATVVFSAHGVAPVVRDEARRRGFSVIDATCPLVAKVHNEVRRFSAQGYQVVLIGHPGHDEIEGTLGEAPDLQVIEDVAGVAGVHSPDGKVAYITQTTLAVDEVAGIVEALGERFPDLASPHSDDICYASQNRQDAVRAMVGDCDLLLVIGSRNSSNSTRLVELGRRLHCPAVLIDDESELDLAWLPGAATIGVTAGASAPPQLVGRVVDALAGLGPVQREERSVTTESVAFTLPPEVR